MEKNSQKELGKIVSKNVNHRLTIHKTRSSSIEVGIPTSYTFGEPLKYQAGVSGKKKKRGGGEGGREEKRHSSMLRGGQH